jgi:hypothetical protein
MTCHGRSLRVLIWCRERPSSFVAPAKVGAMARVVKGAFDAVLQAPAFAGATVFLEGEKVERIVNDLSREIAPRFDLVSRVPLNIRRASESWG